MTTTTTTTTTFTTPTTATTTTTISTTTSTTTTTTIHGSHIQLRNLQNRYLCAETAVRIQCAVYKISWGEWAGVGGGCILSTLKIKQKGLVQRRDFVLVGKFTEGILSTL